LDNMQSFHYSVRLLNLKYYLTVVYLMYSTLQAR
jgi:hypothetical protein